MAVKFGPKDPCTPEESKPSLRTSTRAVGIADGEPEKKKRSRSQKRNPSVVVVAETPLKFSTSAKAGRPSLPNGPKALGIKEYRNQYMKAWRRRQAERKKGAGDE